MNKKIELLYHRNQIWNDLLDLHSSAPEKTRVASSLSMVEILSVIYYGDFIKISKNLISKMMM